MLKHFSSYFNIPSLKQSTIQTIELAVEKDNLWNGYFNGEKGCLIDSITKVGNSNCFDVVEVKLCIPRLFAQISETLYQELYSIAEKQKFAIDYYKAIPLGADLSLIWPLFDIPHEKSDIPNVNAANAAIAMRCASHGGKAPMLCAKLIRLLKEMSQ